MTAADALGTPAAEYALALADDELMIGHRHSEWLATGPTLEEDLAFASIAQDEIGHAVLLYRYLHGDAAGFPPTGDQLRALDARVFGRDPTRWRSCELCELHGDDWADALARHVLYDAAEPLRWKRLTELDPGCGPLAARALADERYHGLHAETLLAHVAASGEARVRLTAAFERIAPLSGALFLPDDEPWPVAAFAESALTILARSGLASDTVTAALRRAPAAAARADRATVRPERREALATMTAVLALDPSARW